jgi:hypothetical protein
MSRSKSQILITGVYRTGSEFVAQIAGCHPALAVSMYSVNALRFLYGRFDPIARPERYHAALAALAERLQARYQRSLPQAEIIAALEGGGEVTYGRIYDEVMCALYLRPPAEHWAEKNQLVWREIPEFLASMPNGRAILVLRDPRSVLVSFKKYTYAPPPAYLGAVFNCVDAMRFASEHRQLVAAGRLLVMRYEDAASRPQAQAERLWGFLGLEGGADVSDQQRWRDAYGKAWHANSSFHPNDDGRAFDVAKSVERWREQITSPELAMTEFVCGAEMEAHGYSLSGPMSSPEVALAVAGGDPAIVRYFEQWQSSGRGIQAFPTDPLDPANWRNE